MPLPASDSPTTVILVRHGRVANPNHVVYSDLPGFDLDAHGVLEAHAVGRHLASTRIDSIVTSPLERARSTARAIAAHHGLEPTIDHRATEWRLSRRWVGQRWDDLPNVLPGQLEAYLVDPSDLAFADETLTDVLERMTSLIDDAAVLGGTTVFVSHQDPIGAIACASSAMPLARLLTDPPPHASATRMTLVGGTWKVGGRWQPDAG